MAFYILLFLVSFFTSSSLFAEALTGKHLEDQSKNFTALKATDNQVTTGEYCYFLNTEAAADPHSLYNDKMDSILRTGTPGSYHYDFLVEQENLPINGITQCAAMRYANWKQTHDTFQKQDTEYGIYDFQEDQLFSINPTTDFFLLTQKEQQESDFLLISHDSRYSLTQVYSQPSTNTSLIIKKPSPSQQLQTASSIHKKHPLEGDLVEFIITYTIMFLGIYLGAQLASAILPLSAAISTIAIAGGGRRSYRGYSRNNRWKRDWKNDSSLDRIIE